MQPAFVKRYVLMGFLLVSLLVGFIFVARLYLTPRLLFLKGGHVRGPSNAPVEIREFSDFQCPACGKASRFMAGLLKRYPYKIKLIFHHFPLKMHAFAMLAHNCAECAQAQGAFWPYHDLLYTHQKEWSALKDPKDVFFQYAKDLNLNEEAFHKCVGRNEGLDVILEDIRQGHDRQIVSTPSFFINERRVIGQKVFESEGEKVIQEELAKR